MTDQTWKVGDLVRLAPTARRSDLTAIGLCYGYYKEPSPEDQRFLLKVVYVADSKVYVSPAGNNPPSLFANAVYDLSDAYFIGPWGQASLKGVKGFWLRPEMLVVGRCPLRERRPGGSARPSCGSSE